MAATMHQISSKVIGRLQEENENLRTLIQDWMNLASQGMGEEEERTFTVEEMFDQYDVLMSRSQELLGGQSSHDTDTHKTTNKWRNLQAGIAARNSGPGNTIA